MIFAELNIGLSGRFGLVGFEFWLDLSRLGWRFSLVCRFGWVEDCFGELFGLEIWLVLYLVGELAGFDILLSFTFGWVGDLVGLLIWLDWIIWMNRRFGWVGYLVGFQI